jgi:hypothetical protein
MIHQNMHEACVLGKGFVTGCDRECLQLASIQRLTPLPGAHTLKVKHVKHVIMYPHHSVSYGSLPTAALLVSPLPPPTIPLPATFIPKGRHPVDRGQLLYGVVIDTE